MVGEHVEQHGAGALRRNRDVARFARNFRLAGEWARDDAAYAIGPVEQGAGDLAFRYSSAMGITSSCAAI